MNRSILTDFYNLNLESEWDTEYLSNVSKISKAKIQDWCVNHQDILLCQQLPGLESDVVLFPGAPIEVRKEVEVVRLLRPDERGMKEIRQFFKKYLHAIKPLMEEEKQGISEKYFEISEQLAIGSKVTDSFSEKFIKDIISRPDIVDSLEISPGYSEILDYQRALNELRFTDDWEVIEYLNKLDKRHIIDCQYNLGYLDTVDNLNTLDGYQALTDESWFESAEFICFVEEYRQVKALVGAHLDGEGIPIGSFEWLKERIKGYSPSVNNDLLEVAEIEAILAVYEERVDAPEETEFQLRWYINVVGLFREIFEETGLWQIKNMKHLAHWSFVKNSELHVRGITYLCNYLGGTVKLSREHKEYFWARVEDIHKLIFVPSYGINMIDLKSISGMLK